MGQKRYDIEGIQVGQPITTNANGKEIKTAINKRRIDHVNSLLVEFE
ncbi:hypothetical protein NPA43_03705 [Bacillus pumilus]|nr:hypothetical protein [Bacillus pumilus]MED1749764.1 hypothetical protein [Bacillus zhangzhouensis]UUD43410.1 hypothetical protein NPA43_03705 [Bacillus pumilus]